MRVRTKQCRIGAVSSFLARVIQNKHWECSMASKSDYLRQLRGIRSHREAAGRVLQNKATLLADLSNFYCFLWHLEGILVM
jgi:hypothetical protein